MLPGDVLHPVVGHTRWSAATREVVRQWWGRDPQFTLVMLSLSSLGALFFHGQLVQKVVTGYSGDTFPNFTPNPLFAGAYERGEVAVEHWSFLAFAQRLEAGARGLPAITTRSIAGSSMESNDGYARVDTPFGEVGAARTVASGCRSSTPIADQTRATSVAATPSSKGCKVRSARRGTIVTAERDRRRHPAVVAPREDPGAPGPGRGGSARWAPIRAVATPVRSRSRGTARDYDFWVEARAGQLRRRLRRVDPALGARRGVAGAVARAC